MIELTINDKMVSVEANTTILEAARSIGVHIPTLCEYKGLSPAGACRVCVVEVEGTRKPVASCHTYAANGMVIKTETTKLRELRKMMIELILATHPLDCPVCDKGGECELQDITHSMGIKAGRYRLDNPVRTKKAESPFVFLDMQRCIQCIRCARYTEEVGGSKSFDYSGSGGYSREMDIRPDADPGGVAATGLTTVCPVGSILNRPMKGHSIRPWQLTTTRTTCPHCSDGCQLMLNTANNEIYRVTAPSETDFSQGHPCLRGRFGFGFVNHTSRLKVPLVVIDGSRKETGWDDALSKAAARLKEIKEKHGAGAIACVPSSRLSNEEHRSVSAFISMIGGVVATTESRCTSSMTGVKEVLGESYSRSLGCVDESDLIIVLGADINKTNPFLADRVSRTARLKEARAVVINPRKTELCRSAWRWLAPRPGTEAALLTWIGKKIIFPRPQGFMPERVEGLGEGGFDWLRDFDESQLETTTGVSPKLIEDVVHALSKAERPCIIVGDDPSYGDNRHLGVAAANLMVLLGRIDSQSAGVFPVVRESNSWGALSIHNDPLDRKALFSAIREGKIKALYLIGEDPVGDWPVGWEDALKSLEFLIVQDSNMTRTAEVAHIAFPSLTFAEMEGTYSDQEGKARRIASSPLVFHGTAMSGAVIIDKLAEKFGYHLHPSVNAVSSRRNMDAAPVPVPFTPAIKPPKEYPFLLLTGKSLYGSFSLFDKCKPLIDAAPEAILEMNRVDAGKFTMRTGDRVRVSSASGSIETNVSIGDTVLPGNLYLPIHPLNGSQKLFSAEGGACCVRLEVL